VAHILVVEDDADVLEYARALLTAQGHSVEVELGYEPATPPEMLYHGTTMRFMDSVLSQGLKKMQRHHVHLSESIEQTMKVGQRRGRPVLLEIDSGQMHRDGLVLYRTPNNVWLTDHVPPHYIHLVLDTAGEQDAYPR